MADDSYNSFGKTLRQIGEMQIRSGELLVMLGSQFDAESDIQDEDAAKERERVHAALDMLHRHVSEAYLLVAAQAQHEADVEEELKGKIGALDKRTERRSKPREEATE